MITMIHHSEVEHYLQFKKLLFTISRDDIAYIKNGVRVDIPPELYESSRTGSDVILGMYTQNKDDK
jgi:hypothetical protein